MRATVAWVLAGLTFLLSVADVVVTAQYRPLLSEAAVAEHGFPFVNGAVLGSAVLGAAIISRYERHAIGWLLSIVGATGAFSLLTEAYSIWVINEGGPGSRSARRSLGMGLVALRRPVRDRRTRAHVHPRAGRSFPVAALALRRPRARARGAPVHGRARHA